MNKRTEVQGIVDELGRIMLPPSFVKKERLEPGSSLEVFAYRNGNILVVPYLEDSGGDYPMRGRTVSVCGPCGLQTPGLSRSRGQSYAYSSAERILPGGAFGLRKRKE